MTRHLLDGHDDDAHDHIARETQDNIERGMSPAEARSAALRTCGSVTRIRDGRVAWTLAWLDQCRQDIRYGLRSMRRAPGFSIVAILTLTLGIGATTAIYSVVNAILLQPLPFPNSDRLVRIVENVMDPGAGRILQRGLTHQEFLEWRARAATLSDAAAVRTFAQRTMRTSNGPAALWGASVSGNTFPLLGARALLGRTVVEGDEANPDAMVLSFDAWQRHFNADPGIIGTAVELRPPGIPRLLTVVGVLPAEFEFPTGALDFYLPMAPTPASPSPRVTMLAHLDAGVSLEAATDEANVIGAAIAPPRAANAPALPGRRFQVLHLKEQVVGTLRPALRVLIVAVGVVLLIVCANVANLLLARGTARQREIAVRLALGAGRGRIVRQILTESAMLALTGGMLGAALGAAGVILVKGLATIDAPGIFRLSLGTGVLPRVREVGVDPQVLAIALALAGMTCLICSLLPAWHLSRTSHAHALGSRDGGSGRGEGRVRAALAVGQLAMATVLLVGAGLLMHSFLRLATIEKGYDPSHVLALQPLVPAEYSLARRVDTIETLLARLRASPFVEAAGFSRAGVLIGEEIMLGTFVPPRRNLEEMRNDAARPRLRPVSAGFVTAMGIPLLAGRELAESDGTSAAPVIVINRSVAQRHFGVDHAVGQVVDWHVGNAIVETRVVGVVEDLRNESLEHDAYPEIFVEYRQLLALQAQWNASPGQQIETAIGRLSLAVRTTGDPASAVTEVRRIVNAVDPNLGIDAIIPVDRLVAGSLARQRFYAVILGVFAAVAALLAAVGIYGVLAYAVVQRTQELGVRMALGAQRRQVLSLVLRKGATLTAIGLAAGLIGAAAGTRVLEGMLFGITPLDAPTFLAVFLMFGLVSLLACYVPARRATRVDPMVALRD
jgi:putative ABC transport system permease protein